MKEIICIICPKSCRLTVDEERGYKVTGNGCPRGAVYGANEARSPVRTLTTTVRVAGTDALLPVKSQKPIPKELLRKAVLALKDVRVLPPVKAGSVVHSDICGCGIDIVACRDFSGGGNGLV